MTDDLAPLPADFIARREEALDQLRQAGSRAALDAAARAIAPEIEALSAVEPVTRIWARNLIVHRRRLLAGGAA